jgi:rod shape-determining protein MreC
VAAFGTATNRPLYGRGPAAGLRFTIYAIIALALMYFDQRALWSQSLRYGLRAMAYPVQVAISSPAVVWHWLTESFESRAALRLENDRLRARQRDLDVAVMRQQALELENAGLRALRTALPPLVKKWTLAEVIRVETNPLRQRLIVNKGARAGVYMNQAVVDANGILGQVAAVGPWSAEIILLTDPEHALPVQITRNQLRTIAVGSGTSAEVLLPYLAVNSDVKSGDLLVSSGLGGVFPAGYPVAKIIGVSRETNQLLAQVSAAPLAAIQDVREVMLIEFDPSHPAAPVKAPEAVASAKPAVTP